MELLILSLSATDETHFKVFAHSDKEGEAEADSVLPFVETIDRRTTLIKVLEVNEFRSDTFQAEEQDWLVAQKWLSDDRKYFQPKMLARIGQAIYDSLFPTEELRVVLQKAIGSAERNGTQLHICLKSNAQVTHHNRLHDYPWELVYSDGKFLAHHQVIFSRYVAHPSSVPHLPPVEQLKVLLVSSGASDPENGLQSLSNKEQKAVFKGLEKAEKEGHIHIDVLKPATLNQLRTYLTEQTPHIVHFDGHGLFGKRCNISDCRKIHRDLRAERCSTCGVGLLEPQGYLLFETEEDEADYISATELGNLLHKASFRDNPMQRGITVAVLSACRSGMALGGESVFNGMAQRLINHRIPAVMAIQYSVRVDAATQFSEQFYRSLGRKNSLATALGKGQEAMGSEGNQWYRPVLYLRWKDNEGGQLFATPKSEVDTPRKSGNSQKNQEKHPDTTRKKQILMLSANPENIDTSRRQEEIKAIRAALERAEHSSSFDLQYRPDIRAVNLSQELHKIKPSVIDIAGRENGIEGLTLGNNIGQNALKNSEKLIAEMFELNAKGSQCILLNGCYSVKQAKEIVQHIEFLIGINHDLEGIEAIKFLDELYYHIAILNHL